ncbi:hypothetical protein DXG01_001244 [Tephrocybe rancida]|nr:hypothetical protein DXG01_001244 [Tephrocybe rancida]
MGGSAFAALLSASAFPRMPPAVYNALKARLHPIVETLYEHAAVPSEAPEKTSYGDVDFIASRPKIKATSDQANAPHDVVQKALGALQANTMEGNRTSNFAIPIAFGEWNAFGHAAEEAEARRLADNGEIFYQESSIYATGGARGLLTLIKFFHAYGDLGMIMGLLARNVGLALGEKGLRMADPPNPPIELSQSFNEILKFMGWSMDAWKSGFQTKREAFEWAGSTKFFNPAMFRSHGEGFTKVKAERKMYAEFVAWAKEKNALAAPVADGSLVKRTEEERQAFRDAALVHFNKKDHFDALARERDQRATLKHVFNGFSVRDWAELGDYWKGVKLIMDAVRERFGGDEGVLRLYGEEGEEGVKRVVLEEKKRLSLASARPYEAAPGKTSEDDLVEGVDRLAMG